MTFRNILVNTTSPTGDSSVPALPVARYLAARFDAKITLFDVVSDLSWALQHLAGGWEQTIEDLSGSKRKYLREQAESLVASGISAEHVLKTGRLSVEILKQVENHFHDLVVKVAEPRSANRSGFLGSTDMRLIQQCPCPVLILRPDEQTGFQHVAAAVDVLDDHEVQQQLDERVFQAGLSITDHELAIVYALPDILEAITVFESDKDVITNDQLAQWNAELTVSATHKLQTLQRSVGEGRCVYHVLGGMPATAIPEYVNSHGVDLLVMGSVARSGLEGLLIGNTAERILESVDCSVLTLKLPPPVS